MHNNILRSAILIVPLALAQSASAQQENGSIYISAFGGFSSPQGDNLTLDGATVGLSYDSGTILGGAVGYASANGPYRAEVEFAYRSGDAGSFAPAFATEGDFASTILMLNGYYEIATSSLLTPYVGAGVGYITEIDFDIDTGINAGEYNARGGFAAQAIVGAEYPLTDALSAYADARFLSAGTVNLTSQSGQTLSADYTTTDINLGLRFEF